MPIVFVHGVGTRKGTGSAYQRRVAARTALMRRILAPALKLDPASTLVLNPFWGDDAANFRWNHASLPTADGETFGPGGNPTPIESALAEHLTDVAADSLTPGRTLLHAARSSPVAAVDLLWTAAAEVEWASGTDFDNLACFAEHATAWAEAIDPAELDAMPDDLALFRRMVEAAAPPPSEHELFGGDSGVTVLREGLSRLRTAGSRLASEAAAAAVRRRVHESAAGFVGDVLAYLRQREQDGDHGAIAAIVAADLERAMSARTDEDPRVIVIAHSMGGNIVFDLLSNPRLELSCDVLLTVGSQVGLFAELDLLPAVEMPVDAASSERHRSLRPSSIGRWLNVYDRCDVLSFATEGIFAGVEDYAYSTGKGILKAHSSYFTRPSFFRRLAHHIGESR